jgi:hypothetical protein
MNSSVMFMDCPAHLDRGGRARCGLPAEVEYRYTVSTMAGLLESAKIRCPRGHWFNGPVEALTWEKHPVTSTPAATRAAKNVAQEPLT